MAARAFLSEATWSQWRYLATFHIDTSDLKAQRYAASSKSWSSQFWTQYMKTFHMSLQIRNILPRQSSFFLCGFVVSRRFLYCFFCWIQPILYCFFGFGSWLFWSLLCYSGLKQASLKMAADLPISLRWSPCLCLVQQYGRCDVSLQRFISTQVTCNKRNKIHNKTPRQWSLFCVVLFYQEGFSIVTAI